MPPDFNGQYLCFPNQKLYNRINTLIKSTKPKLGDHMGTLLLIPNLLRLVCMYRHRILITLESGIDVGQGITVGPGKFVKKNKRRALNKHRAWTKCANLCYKKPIKLENICRPWEKIQNLINVGPLIRL
jgi:hypothetical protein